MSSLSPKTLTTKPGQPVTIRSAQPDDAARLIAFVHSVLPESPLFGLEPNEFDRTEDQERQWIQEHIDGPGKLVVLAEVSGMVVGCLTSTMVRAIVLPIAAASPSPSAKTGEARESARQYSKPCWIGSRPTR